MPALVGFIVVAIAFSTVATVLYFVTREKHEHEEYYIPGQTPEMLSTSEKKKTSEANG